MRNQLAPELALDVDSIMERRGNTPTLMEITEEVQRSVWVCLEKEKSSGCSALFAFPAVLALQKITQLRRPCS